MEVARRVEAQTASWFEFLFDNSGKTLKEHLDKPDADPGASKLLFQFLEKSLVPASLSTDGTTQSVEAKRSYRLRSLAVHVACHSDWNLDFIENSLPLPLQRMLMMELAKDIPLLIEKPASVDITAVDKNLWIKLVIYCCWVVRALFKKSWGGSQNISNNCDVQLQLAALMKTFQDEKMFAISILEQILDKLSEDLSLPTPSPLVPADKPGIETPEGEEKTTDSNCEQEKRILMKEVKLQVSYDLARMFFHEKNYQKASSLFKECSATEPVQSPFCCVDMKKLRGFQNACELLLEDKTDTQQQESMTMLSAISKERLEWFQEGKLSRSTQETAAETTESNDRGTVADFVKKIEKEVSDPVLKLGMVKGELLTTNNGDDILQLVKCLHSLSTSQRLQEFQHELYHSIIANIPDKVMSTLMQIILFKAKHFIQIKEFACALNLMSYGYKTLGEYSKKTEEKSAVDQVKTIIQQEMLAAEILYYDKQDEKSPEKLGPLTKRARCYLSQITQVPVPCEHIVSQILAFLLNQKEWDVTLEVDVPIEPSFTDVKVLSQLLALTCTSVSRSQTWRKVAKNLFDGVLRIFTTPSKQHKRPCEDGPPVAVKRESETLTVSKFMTFIKKLKEEIALSVMMSCLVRINNANNKEGHGGSKDVYTVHSHLWPTSLTNPSSVNFDQVASCMTQTIQHALTVHPHHAAWLRTYGDIYFVSGDYSSAMKHYLQSGCEASSFFSQAVPSSVWPDQVYRRMIVCCTALNAHTQVAIFCQCTEPNPDYNTAMKAFQQVHSEDAMDLYYDCFWDVTMMEFLVHYLAVRGESNKKQRAIAAMGQPDINTCNSPEVLSYAKLVRMTRFLRSLLKQYCKV